VELDREPLNCGVCKQAHWRVAIYYQDRPPTFLCRTCLLTFADAMPEGCLYTVRVSLERRYYFGGIGPLVAWLFPEWTPPTADELKRLLEQRHG
jgi:hypothetical protein